MDELLSDFLTETAENLSVVDNEIVRWERDPTDRAILDNIFRLVHTIKGTCGFLDLPRLEALAHAAETVLGRVRDGSLMVSAQLVTEVLAALDGIKAILRALERDGKEPAGDDAVLIARLERISGAEPVEAAEPEPVEVAEEVITDDGEVPSKARSGQTIRVSVDLLEQLMTTVSELVLTRNQLLQLARRTGSDAFTGPLQRLSQCVGELQEGVTRTRMQPIRNAWSALPRIVRGLSVDLDKKIELEMHGGDTELDRQVLELIKDPLAHMVRNAADHGIEPPQLRAAAGKREVGRVKLSAHQEGGHIVIELSDDGRGLDLERLKERAVEVGIVRRVEADSMSKGEVAKLIFHPGISTAETVTSVSGRGVGMDVVKSNIERIGGTIEVDSISGRGTRFTIKIPLTLAIVSALIVASGGERFAVPQIAVLELVRAGGAAKHRIERVHDAMVLRLRERLLPLVSLSGLLGLPDVEAKEERFVVVVQAGSFSFGIIVDNVSDTEEIVVKPVAPLLSGLNLYAGNAILGDGQVIMILDVNGLALACAGAAHTRADEDRLVDDRMGKRVNRDSMLIFHAGSTHPKAVPLPLVSRLEEIDVESIEWAQGQPVVQYRGDVMPLLCIDGSESLRATGQQPVLVFTDRGRAIGLAVDEVIDIFEEEEVDIRLSSEGDGRLGTAVIGGRVTEIIDVGHYLQLGLRQIERVAQPPTHRTASVLIVDDSAFFRNMLRPLLVAAGYEVTTASGAEEALRLRDDGHRFDLILSDIEMPGLSGIEFARTVRSGGEWVDIPLVALSALTSDASQQRGREAGFDEYVPKFDQASLLTVLEQTLGRTAA